MFCSHGAIATRPTGIAGIPCYLNDGQDLFDRCTGTSGTGEEWRVDETVDSLIAAGAIPPIIVVGIDNGGRRLRPKEYLPYVDAFLNPPEPDPQGRRYPQFLFDQVIPFVERRYRIAAGAEHTVLGGSSYGAGVALFTAMNRPGRFGGLLLESASLYADDDHLLKGARSFRNWPRRIYLGVGTVNEPQADVQKLRTLLIAAGLTNERLLAVTRQGAGHSQRWWGERLPEALRFLFPK